ncbi:hypothetical protein CsSME_00040984 [Camellia sinensis var. sinensis]
MDVPPITVTGHVGSVMTAWRVFGQPTIMSPAEVPYGHVCECLW